jgi:conjugal transfer pilus assembly protein TraA
MQTHTFAIFASLLACALLAAPAGELLAATTGSEWQTLFNRLSGWSQGLLMRAFAFAALLVGIGLGIAQGSALPAVTGIVVALLGTVVPGVITGMLTALV